jgi:hypothetical protein
VPFATKCDAATRSLFYHLIGEGNKGVWNGKTEGLGRLEVDAESVWHDVSRARIPSAIFESGCMVPISLFAQPTETNTVSGFNNVATASAVTISLHFAAQAV